MAQQQTQFIYHNIQLYKSESLGSGSYGGVCKAECDGLLCAAKIMHPTLFDLHDPGIASYLHKFQEECHLLSLARHPNVVQYLGTCYDPDTQLPVLLMEYCDESLTAFLERSPGPLSYHIQLNICLDIALALVYLHSNGLIHRDLTGNNVLMLTGIRAKITDFGMSRLATRNPRMTTLTMCPGNLLYMSPEALDEAKSYTARLDIFSFGVIVIQILTMLYPNPTDRFRIVYSSQFDEEVRLLVPETERRQAHLQLIPDTHSLKPLVLQCLKKEMQRPSAHQLSERLSKLKQAPQYTESMQQPQNNSEIQQLKQLLQSQIEAKTREANEQQAQLQRMLEAKDRQLQEKQQIIEENNHIIEENQRKIATNQREIETKDRQLHQTQQQLQDSQQLVVQLNQSLQHKDKTISDLQQTISHRESEIQWLKQQDIDSSIQPQQLPITQEKTQKAAPVSVAQNDISKMTWREGKKAPEAMRRGAAIVDGNTAYFRPFDSVKVYSYQNFLKNERWCRLPDNPNGGFSLAVIDGLLTSVGGYYCHFVDTNTLLSLIEEGERKQWSEVFPPMPTPRSSTACMTTEQAVVVAGGNTRENNIATVEVMDINTKQWITVCPLPQKLRSLSGIVCGDSLYLTGGTTGLSWSKSVFTCSLCDLLRPETLGSRMRRKLTRTNVWKEISSLPVTVSTLASFGGHLLAIGGEDDLWNPTTGIYRYDSHGDLWHVTNQMKNKRSKCLVVTLPGDQLVIVGGNTGLTGVPYERIVENWTDSVEILKDK